MNRSLRAGLPCLLVAALSACTARTDGALVHGVAGPGSGVTLSVAEGELAGAALAVPSGASVTTATVAIAAGRAGELPRAARAVGPAVALLPHGARFAVPVTVTVPFDASQLRKDETLKVFHYEEATGERTELAIRRVDRARGLVEAVTDRFSTVVAASAPIPWWDLWPCFSANDGSGLPGVQRNGGNAVISCGHDESVGPLWREQNTQAGAPFLAQLHAQGSHALAWIEGNGQSRESVCSVHANGDGTYQIDPTTGAAQTLDNWWTWTQRNPAGNEVHYFGVTSFVNGESWLGPFVLSNPKWGLSVPTYPDGTPALGWNGDTSNPTLSRFHDAVASKNLNGGLFIEANYALGNLPGLVYVTPGNNPPGYSGDISIGKDTSCPWWLDYNKQTAAYFAQHDLDGLWMDNASGWDQMGARPIERAFGNWSVAGFTAFLAQHPEVGITDPDFDVKAYLRNLLKTLVPSANPASTTDAGWADARFCSDPVWRAFLCYKSQQLGTYFRALHQGVKDGAAASGNFPNPDDFFQGGNDVPALTYGAYTGDEIDACHCEYNPSGGPDTGAIGRGLPPEGHAGPVYSAAVQYGHARRAYVWYYLDGANAPIAHDPNLSQVLGYEALSQNVTIYNGTDNAIMEGTDASQLAVNQTIQRLAPTLGHRGRTGTVGVLYSTDTQHSRFAPGGFCEGDRPQHTLGYNGWCMALEELQVPYRAIPDFKLTAAALDGVSVLVLANVLSIEPDVVANVLVPFIQAGHAVIVTGADAGSLRGKPGLYGPNTSNLLADLTTRSDLAPGAALFVGGNPGLDFYVDQTRQSGRAPIANALATLRAGGQLPVEADLSGLTPRVRVTLHEDEVAGTAFADLVNVDLDRPSDTLTPAPGGQLLLRVPPLLQGAAISVTGYDADAGAGAPLTATFVNATTLSIQVPSFRVYLSVVLAASPGGIAPPAAAASLTITSAATFGPTVAPGSWATAFGQGLAASASSVAPALTVSGLSVAVIDASGATRAALISYVDPGQLNFLVPEGTASGSATVSVSSASGVVGRGTVAVANVAPGIFLMPSAAGSTVPAGWLTRVHADGTRDVEALSQVGPGGTYVLEPVDLGVAAGDQVYLSLWGTGFRHGQTTTAVVGGLPATVTFAGVQNAAGGIDQANLLLPPLLAGSGVVSVTLTVDGIPSNSAAIDVK
jgi:uncharacterized protein (TIGR03437 family)